MTGPGEPAVPLFDIEISAAEREAVDAVLRSGWLTMGPRTEEFEAEFARSLGVAHVVAVSSGTAALHLAYLGAGVGPGDEVIVPAITFVATANAVRYCGGTPVLSDVVGVDDFGIDVSDVERRITPRTKAVCAVHYGGYGANLSALERLCEERDLILIEDAAHSPSATAADAPAKLGTRGLAGAFSFFSNKVLSCGEGGALATDDDRVATLARSLRSHGLTTTTWDRHRGHSLGYDVVGLGFNYRIDESRAALLSRRLIGLEENIAQRRQIVQRYRRKLAGVDGVEIPYSDDDVMRSSCYVMPVVLADGSIRDELRTRMMERHGVQTSLLYPSLAQFSAFEEFDEGSLPASAQVARRELTLPLFPQMTDEQQGLAIEALVEGLAELG